MRILMLGVNHGPNLRGSNVAVRALARALVKRGHQPTLVQAAAPADRQLDPDFAVEYVSSLRKSVYPLHQALRRLSGYDVLHTHDQAGGGIALRSWLHHRMPWVAQFQPPKVRAAGFRRAGWRWRWIGLSARRAPAVLTPSRWLAAALAERYGIPAERLHTLPYGVGEHWFRGVRGEAAAASGPLVVSLVNMKGVDVALRAVARVGARHDLRLELFGDGPDASHRRLARQLGLAERVRFHGFVDNRELPSRLAGSALLLHPTPAESFGQVLAEAAALGLPTVATRVNATPEVVEHERTGLLCPPGDVDAFAAALDRLLDDAALRARLGDAGHARALERWRWEQVAERLEREVYLPLVERRRALGAPA